MAPTDPRHDGRSESEIGVSLDGATSTASDLRRLEHDIVVLQEELLEISKQLEESRSRYLDIYELAPVGYLTLDEHSKILEINLKAASLIGIERLELMQMPFTRFMKPGSGSLVRSQLSYAATKDRKGKAEVELNSGACVQFECTASRELDTGDLTFLATLLDITERKNSEQTVHVSNARALALIESSDDVIWAIDAAYKITVANQYFETMRDELSADLFGTRLRQLTGEEEECRHWWRSHYHEALAGEVLRVERRFSIDGKQRFFDIVLNPIRDEHKITGAVIIARDISMRHEYELALDNARRNAEELSKAKSSFMSHVAHEVRTPLNAIISFATLLGKPLEPQQMARFSTAILNNARRLVETTGELLTLAKLDSKKMPVKVDVVDALLEIELLIDAMSSLSSEKGLHVEMESKYSELLLQADPLHFRQIMTNLLTNAIKFTDSGRITVTVTRVDTHTAEIAVTDTGIGIDERHLPFIFEEFFQEPLEDRDQNIGAGLGLPIVKKLCTLMGGDAFARSTKDSGSTFIVRLPLAKR